MICFKRPAFFFIPLFFFSAFFFNSHPVFAEKSTTGAPASETARDIYFKTTGVISGPSSPEMTYPESYRGNLGIDNRSVLWIFIQQHFFLGSFILGVPMMAWMLEIYSFLRRKGRGGNPFKYDQLAKEFMEIALPFYPLTIIFGVLLLGAFLLLYGDFSRYMATVFKPVLYFYLLVFFLENVLLYAYTKTWNQWQEGRKKWQHLWLGAGTVLNGIAIIYLANALMAFMMSPAGIDKEGRYLGNIWNAVNTALWNPLNVHRILASIMFSGAVIAAYAAFQMITTRDPEKKAHYDWMGHVSIMIAIINLFILPFAGYWFAKAIFIYRNRMGVTLMGGKLSWPFIMQAILIGLIFLAVTFYLWQGTARMQGSARYQHLAKHMMIILVISILVWTTPHTLPATSGEFKAMGSTQHPIVGYYGTMAAKNTAINTMMLSFGICYIIFQRCNKKITVSWRRWGNIAIILLFALAEAYIIFVGVYGFFIPANIRVKMAFPQFSAAMGALFGGMILNWMMLRRSKKIGPIQWGKLPLSGAFALFSLAVFISTTMVLMGYIRSSVRLDWHITEVMKDTTPWAGTPSLGYAVGMVLFNVAIFWGIATLIFWSGKARKQGFFFKTREVSSNLAGHEKYPSPERPS
ncbi:MAG: cytochrome ubiquinol oxidase subunit I [Nitrospiria bacterium]